MKNIKNTFKEEFCTSIHEDKKRSTYYFKIPVEGYVDLNVFQQSLLTTIDQLLKLSDLTDHSSTDIFNSIRHLNRVIKEIDLYDECCGLEELINSKSI